MRTVVSYDDIVTPQNNASAQIGPPLPSTTQPPAKKRRTSHQKAQNRPSAQQQIQHWDDPGDDADVMHYGGDSSGAADAMDYAEEEDESRELTHEEIWDDSALIDAWNSAAAEYEAYHGKGKKWKEEPVKRSPLWYNVPSPEKQVNGESPSARAADASAVEDSEPHDFETFVPTHDPSLASTLPGPVRPESGYYDQHLGGASASAVSKDEAFSRALAATYWAGYWTAIYHCQSGQELRNETSFNGLHNDETAVQEEDEEDGEGDMADLVSTQR